MKHFKLSSLLLTVSLLVSISTFALDSNAIDKNGSDQKYRQTIAKFYDLTSTKNLTLLHLKSYQQTEDYTCGEAAVMSLLHYYGMLTDAQMNKETEMRLAKEIGASKLVGTSPQQIAVWLNNHGFDVQLGENGTLAMLQENLKKGIPVMVEWIDWGGHWVLATGYDAVGKTPNEDKDTLFLADPSAQVDKVKTMNGVISFNPDRFANMWFDAQFFNPGHLVRGVYIIAVPKKPSFH